MLSSVHEMALLQEGCHKEPRQMQVATDKIQKHPSIKAAYLMQQASHSVTTFDSSPCCLLPLSIFMMYVLERVLDWEPGNLGPCCYSAPLA